MARKRDRTANPSFLIRLSGIAGLALWLLAPATRAQVARVATVQRTVEKRSGGAWSKIGAGAALGVGDSLRTGKRSKVDLKFADGSLLRLGALSSIDIQSAKGVRLTGGQVLFSALRPGRVLAGSGTAEIRGSVGIISLAPGGEANFTLFSGAMDVTAGGQTTNVPPGNSLSATTNGALSGLRTAAPFGFAGGSYTPDLVEEPENAPFTGSAVNGAVRNTPVRTTLDQSVPQANPAITNGTGFENPTPQPTVPFPTPFPPDPLQRARQSQARALAVSERFEGSLQLAQLPGQSTLPRQELPAVDVAINDLNRDLDTRAALDHLEDVSRGRGDATGGEAALIAALADGGVSVYGARLRGFAARGRFFFEGTLQPLRVRSNRSTRDLSSIANAFMAYRDKVGEIQIGRQRFLSGPTQASLFGSLVRQGGRETMDAIRIAPKLGSGRQLEFAYIYDAFPRNLPYQFSGAQKALYGRAALRRPNFNLGLNAFKYTNAQVDNTTGLTLDFTLPLARDQVELYGEAGRDSFRRRLTTLGLSFPGLFERTDFDVFLEYANLGDRTGVSAPPSETTLRVYRRFGRHLNTVTGLSRFGGGAGYNFTFGLSLGAGFGSQDPQ